MWVELRRGNQNEVTDVSRKKKIVFHTNLERMLKSTATDLDTQLTMTQL